MAEDQHLLLTDFNLAKDAGDATTVCGTPEFMAPEQWTGAGTVGVGVDYWALGCFLYLLLSERTPFYVNGRYANASALVGAFAPLGGPADALIAALLVPNAGERLRTPAALREAWFDDTDFSVVLAKKADPPVDWREAGLQAPAPETPEDADFRAFEGDAVDKKSPTAGASPAPAPARRQHHAESLVLAYEEAVLEESLERRRVRLVRTFCDLKAVDAPRGAWEAILDEAVVYSMPLVKYRTQHHVSRLNDCGTIRVFHGLDAYLADQRLTLTAGGAFAWLCNDMDVIVGGDASHAAFQCAITDTATGASTPCVGTCAFRGEKISEMAAVWDVLGFTKSIEAAREDPTTPVDRSTAPGGASRHMKSVSDFDFLRKVGKGALGTVWAARHRGSGDEYAIKITNKDMLRTTGLWRRAVAEKTVLEATRHPFVVAYHGSFQDALSLYLVMEYQRAGTLESFQQEQPQSVFEVGHARLLFAELALAVDHLHDRGYAHRDVKPENILISSGGHVKLGDFGCVAPCGEADADEAKEAERLTMCGSPLYIAPEVLKGLPYTRAVDYFSLGVVLHVMLSNRHPYAGDRRARTYPLAVALRCPRPNLGDLNGVAELTWGLLRPDPVSRYGADDVRTSAFLRRINMKLLDAKQDAPKRSRRRSGSLPSPRRNLEKFADFGRDAPRAWSAAPPATLLYRRERHLVRFCALASTAGDHEHVEWSEIAEETCITSVPRSVESHH